MHRFVLGIDVVVGDVVPVKFFSVKYGFICFFIIQVFAHDFEQDGPVAVQDLIDSFSSIDCDFIELIMIHSFAGSGAENFVRAPGKRLLAETAETLVSL